MSVRQWHAEQHHQHEHSRAKAGPELFFCPLTLRFEVLCPLGPGWGCPHASEGGAGHTHGDSACHDSLVPDSEPFAWAAGRLAVWR